MSSLEKLAHSSYESYSETAKAYDVTRVPVGLAILIERFSTSGLALAHQQVLDVGCGAGNYLDALKGTIGLLAGIDGSQEMLLRASQKCAGHSNVVLERGSILELPFQDRLFDGVMINQVLHHLSASSDLQQYNLEGPFRKEWRDGDSAFAVYRDQDDALVTRLGELKRKILDHSISEIVAKSERIRKVIGQYVVISVRRP